MRRLLLVLTLVSAALAGITHLGAAVTTTAANAPLPTGPLVTTSRIVGPAATNAADGLEFNSNSGTNTFLFRYNNNPLFIVDDNVGVRLGVGRVYLWSSTNNANGTADTSLSRISAGLVGVGTGAAGSVAGLLSAAGYVVSDGAARFIGANEDTVRLASNKVVGFSSSTDTSAAGSDVAFSRVSAGVIGVGTGAQGSFAGTVKATGYTVGAGSTLTNYTTWADCTPTVTLVGGAGNTVPVYTTNTCRWMQIGKKVSLAVRLTGDGGNEGAGTGVLTLTLPVATGASISGLNRPIGRMVNNATVSVLYGQLTASSTALSLTYMATISTNPVVTGAEQNNATRTIDIAMDYEVD